MLFGFLVICGCLSVTSCSNEEVINRWQQHLVQEEDNTARARWTLFWDSRREKVTRYVNDTRGRINLTPNEQSTLRLPRSDVNNFRRMTEVARSRPGRRQKVLEVSNMNFFDVLNGRTNPRQNVTCATTIMTNCSYTVRVPYLVCRPSFFNRNCIRFREERRTGLCSRMEVACCKGYKLGSDQYCERVRSNTESGCGGSRYLRNRSGIISTPNYPNKYPTNLDCRWTIAAPSTHVIVLSLMDLDLENPIGYCNLNEGNCMNLCQFDVLEVRHTSNNRTRTLCGSLKPQMDFRYRGSAVEINFRTDESNQRRGFKLAYSTVPGASLIPRSCPNGQVWQTCRRICRLTCDDVAAPRSGLWQICIRGDGNHSLVEPSARDDIMCVPGCECPTERPIWHRGNCVKVEVCPARSFACGEPFPAPTPKILGGSTARDGAWPWMVQITKNNLHADCAGTLICSDWLVTAAHCFLDRATWTMPETIDINLFWFHLGKYWKYDQEDGRRVETYRARFIIVHPRYNFTTDLNDIALVKLSGFARQWDRIRPICLPQQMSDLIQTEKQWEQAQGFPRIGDQCVATGWGVTRDIGPSSNRLKQLLLPIKPENLCSYNDFEWKKIICAGGLIGADTCQGDSGGPYMCKEGNRWYIHGITSFGNDCGRGVPGGYTRVSNYVRWIRSYIGGECQL